MKRIFIVPLVILVAILIPMAAQATPILTFYNITNNAPSSVNIASQLTVDVTDYGSNCVLFNFLNSGPIASVIREVYFDDGTLLGISQIINNPPEVIFSQWATPAELPGANNVTPVFETTAGFSADADTPHPTEKGVGPGEQLGIVFNLINGKTYSDTLAALDDGSLRIGLHVQSIGSSGKSDSFVNNPPNNPPIPEPGTLLLLGSGLIGLVGYAKFRVSRKK